MSALHAGQRGMMIEARTVLPTPPGRPDPLHHQETDVENSICRAGDCTEPIRMRGWCERHHQSQMGAGLTAPADAHDTELCAWWEQPCDRYAWSQDLCRVHFNRAWWADQKAPRFARHTLDFIRTRHVVRDVDVAAMTGTCSICGPDVRVKRRTTRRRTSNSVRHACARTDSAQQRRQSTGWDEETYDLAVIAQGNRCAICSRPPEDSRTWRGVLHADHCHQSMKPRGLLCGHCNQLLGLARDAAATLDAAAAYLRAHEVLPNE